MSRRRSRQKYGPAAFLDFLMSAVYDRMTLHWQHQLDLEHSALTAATIAQQRIRTVPPWMMPKLLGYSPPKGVRSGYVIPYAALKGGWMPHVRMKIFPSIERGRGASKRAIKYLQPRASSVRIFFPIMTINAALYSMEHLYVVEGEKKSLAVAQTGVATIGIAGVEGWHEGGSEKLHPDFDDVGLENRVVHLWPDGDIENNPMVRYAMDRLGLQLKARGVKAMTIVRPELTA